jgi:predicted outer membrane repeat protein
MKYLFLSFIFLFSFTKTNASVWYVKYNATGAANGNSWTDAFTDIASAISASANGDEIWVAAGIYKPSVSTTAISFTLKSGVDLYGGFNGTETLLTQRNVLLNPTIASGDIGVVGYPTDNSRHIFRATNLALPAIVDGFTIKDGYDPTNYGGGALIIGSNITFENCKFLSNYGNVGGAIFHQTSGTLTLLNCLFDNNIGAQSGGAVYCQYTNLIAKKVIFTSNQATNSDGGAIKFQNTGGAYFYNLDQCTFINNYADNDGGAIYGYALNANININNCLFAGNKTGYNSLLYLIESSSANNSNYFINNCTFANNAYDSTITAIYQHKLLTLNADSVLLSNSIVWQNKFNKIIDTFNGVNNCIIQNGFAYGTNVLNVDPKFVVPNTINGSNFLAIASDYQLSTISPAINYGNNNLNTTLLDLNDSARVQNAIVDLGSFENTHCTFVMQINTNSNSHFCTGDTVYLSASAGHHFLWNGINNASIFNATNNGVVTLTALDTLTGCRADTIKNIQFIAPINQTINAMVCYGQNYILPNATIINNITAAQTQVVNFTSSANCDSIITVNINLHPHYTIAQTKYVCFGNSYTFPDAYVMNNIFSNTFHASNLTTINGCDSIINTTIVVSVKDSSFNNVMVCRGASYTFIDGQTVTNIFDTFTHTSLIQNTFGCDSIVKTHVYILQQDTTITVTGIKLKSNQVAAAYQWYNCITGQIISGAISQTYTPTVNGTYAVILSYNGCKDTSECKTVTSVDINNLSNINNISVFPNPNNGKFYLDIEGKYYLEIYNNLGVKISSKFVNGTNVILDFSMLAKGNYYLRVSNNSSWSVVKFEIH